MRRRDLLLKFLGTAGATLLYPSLQASANLLGLPTGFDSYRCILSCEIPQSLTTKEYLKKKYEVYSFHEIKKLVDTFKQKGQILTEYRLIENGTDRWYATFRSRQDFLYFIDTSKAIGLDQKEQRLHELHGLKQQWILPS